MIARYARERGYCGEGKDPWLTLGKEYAVLGILIKLKKFSIQVPSDDDDRPVFFDLQFFDIIDSRIPNGWNFFQRDVNTYNLCPTEFGNPTFWDLFHNSDLETVQIFQAVVNKIKTFHGLLDE